MVAIEQSPNFKQNIPWKILIPLLPIMIGSGLYLSSINSDGENWDSDYKDRQEGEWTQEEHEDNPEETAMHQAIDLERLLRVLLREDVGNDYYNEELAQEVEELTQEHVEDLLELAQQIEAGMTDIEYEILLKENFGISRDQIRRWWGDKIWNPQEDFNVDDLNLDDLNQ